MHPLSGGVALMARIDASWRAQANGNEGRKAPPRVDDAARDDRWVETRRYLGLPQR